MNKQEILNDNMDFWRSVKIEIPDGRRRLLLDDIDLAIKLGDLKALDELRGYLARADCGRCPPHRSHRSDERLDGDSGCDQMPAREHGR
jgi:hypothetical protein